MGDYVRTVVRWIAETLGFSPAVQSKLLSTVFAILFLWLCRWLVLAIIFRRTEDVKVRYRWRKITIYVASGLAIFLVGRVWYVGFQSLSTYLGLLTSAMTSILLIRCSVFT